MTIVCTVIGLYTLVLFVRVAMSWFPLQPDGIASQIYSVLYTVTEPLLAPVRGLFRPVQMGGMALDLSVLVVFFALMVVSQILCP